MKKTWGKAGSKPSKEPKPLGLAGEPQKISNDIRTGIIQKKAKMFAPTITEPLGLLKPPKKELVGSDFEKQVYIAREKRTNLANPTQTSALATVVSPNVLSATMTGPNKNASTLTSGDGTPPKTTTTTTQNVSTGTNTGTNASPKAKKTKVNPFGSRKAKKAASKIYRENKASEMTKVKTDAAANAAKKNEIIAGLQEKLSAGVAASTPSVTNSTAKVGQVPATTIINIFNLKTLANGASKTPSAAAMASAVATAAASATATVNKEAIAKIQSDIEALKEKAKGTTLTPDETKQLASLEAQRIDINLKITANAGKQPDISPKKDPIITSHQAELDKISPQIQILKEKGTMRTPAEEQILKDLEKDAGVLRKNIKIQISLNFKKQAEQIKQDESNVEKMAATLESLKSNTTHTNKVSHATQIATAEKNLKTAKAKLVNSKIAISRNKNATKRKINARQAPNITKKNSNNIFNFDKLGTFIVPKTTINAVTNAVTLPVTNPVANAISKNLTELVTVGTNVQKSIKTSVDEQIALKPRKPTKLETNSEFIEKDIDNLKPTNKGWLWGKISQIWRSPRQRLFNEYVSQHKSTDPTGEQYKQGLRAYLKKKVLETSVAADKKYKENLTYKTAIEDIMEKNQSAKIDKSKALASAISELMDERGETPETLTKKEAKQIRKEGKKIVKDSGKASRKAWKAQKTIINSDYMSTIREGQGILNKLRIRTNQGTKYNRKVRKILGIPNNSPIVPLKPNGPAPVTGPAPAPVFVSRKQAEFNQMKRNNKIQKAAVAEVAAKAEVEAVEAQIASEKLPGFEGPQRNPLYTPIPEPISETVDPRKPLKQINLPATGTDKQTKKGKRTALVNNPNLTTQGVNNKKLTSEQMVLTNAQRAKMTMTNKYTYTDADKLNLSPEKLIQVEAAEKKAKETAAAKAKYTEELLARPEFANTEVQAKIQTNSNTSKLSNAEFRTQIKADKATLKQYKKQKQLKKKNLQIVLKKIFQKTINNSQLLKAHKDEQAAAKSDAKKKRRITAKAAKAAKDSQSASFTPTRRNTLFKNPNKDYIQVDA